jgi:Cupin-like domain
MLRSRFQKKKPHSFSRTSSSRAFQLSPDALDWLVLNLARGLSRDEIIQGLCEAGVPVANVIKTLDELRNSPLTTAYIQAVDQRARARETRRLERLVRRDEPGILEVSTCPAADEFRRAYWLANTPLIVRGYVTQWPRPPRFDFQDLRNRFSEVEVEVVRGRDKLDRPDLQFGDLQTKMKFGDYLDLVLTSEGDDSYLVARNRVIEQTEIGCLLDELEPPADLFDVQRSRGISLWLGPKGTHTKLHHDATNNFFCQVLGKKRITLIPPATTFIADAATGYYATHSTEDARRIDPTSVYDVELEPGDGIFIPVGWWHEVWSLAPSLSLAVVGFKWPNSYDYRPGRPLRERESLG